MREVPLLAAGYHRQMLAKVEGIRRQKRVYPAKGCELKALELTGFDAVRVVVLGQDPYHGVGQAQGLAFSVPEGVKVPPSLRNIFAELRADVYGGRDVECAADLRRWAVQGVLLLNACLTVEEGAAGSHRGLGWEALTDQIVACLAQKRQHLVFLLWGGPARQKAGLIDAARHCVLEAAHPSPLSAYRGFFGCRHFSRANEYLEKHGATPVVW